MSINDLVAYLIGWSTLFLKCNELEQLAQNFYKQYKKGQF
ncbi:ClbS/DfsB family four-helix bundle protein [Flavobacterium sp. CYK-55]|nr:ClbS/DfsB family four-helix bundle protein [Flavobacterium sp. CYK-55]